jgi:hypothetical protein
MINAIITDLLKIEKLESKVAVLMSAEDRKPVVIDGNQQWYCHPKRQDIGCGSPVRMVILWGRKNQCKANCDYQPNELESESDRRGLPWMDENQNIESVKL